MSAVIDRRYSGVLFSCLSMKQYLFPDDCQFGRDNLVLHASGRRHRVDNFPGPLSIKTVIDGQATWIVDGRELVVDTGSFLILNDGQKYSMNLMDAPRPIETCCAFFRKGYVEQIAQDATTSLQASLDDPSREAPPLQFLARLHRDPNRAILSRLSIARRFRQHRSSRRCSLPASTRPERRP